ncbi:NAD(P)H-dependent oxidoreductase [Desulfonema magnum]|uniref:NADPH-dependent FMN reductase n=1 Tax=Desulfonema magnum TaxID=45655 RepID=A0A975GRL0_9BACT|nr:NAD(P)H-dependent oxidoreductase [Desulfonema magnum]QTA91166.1 NADPH-dependent FMN reductase [Desulfonema magnum]
MLVLGLQGSPRKKGNSDFLLSAFMKEAEELGAQTHVVDVDKKNIVPCKEYTTCEKKGFCPIKDDMKYEIYPLLRQADVIVAASPMFFYNVTAQLKALIDRCQTLWARKYKLKLTDPGRKMRRGFILAVGATKGKNLFEGLHLTATYFFDAVGASYEGSLTYREIEHRGDMEKHPSVLEDVKTAVNNLLTPFLGRKKILFACRENACRSQMASAFAQYLSGDKIEVLNGGSTPADNISPVMVKAMQEKGIDMEFRTPQSIEAAIEKIKPDMIITMGCGEECPFVPGAEMRDWELPDPAGEDIEFMRNVRDEIEKRVISLTNEL